jgi:hypothetical protein
VFSERESLVVSPTFRALSFKRGAKDARCERSRSRNICFGHVLVAARQGKRRDTFATGRERLGRCTAGQSKYIRRSWYSYKLALAAIYLRRVRVVGHSITPGAPPLTHVCTVGACDKRPRRGPPAALPGQACGGMPGTMVRIAPPQNCEATFFFDSSKRFEKKIWLNRGSSRPGRQAGTRTHNFTFSVAAVSAGTPL